MSKEPLLANEKALEKIARYGAHFSRGLYQALHALEALHVEANGRRRAFSPPRRAGAEKLKLPNEPPLADSPLELV